ncbi:MAG: DNA polymerase III subunit alpha, partial [Duganella sp.]
TVYAEVFEENKHMFKEDEFLAVIGKVSEDRFSGGLRISAEKVFDIVSARVKHGKQLAMALPTTVDVRKMAEVLAPHRHADGLPISMRITPQGVGCVVQLGEGWRVAPSDDLQHALRQVLGAQEVEIEY